MVIKEKCRVTWCNNLRKKRSQVCEKHSQYKNICRAAIRLDRPHLMYKVEKWLEGFMLRKDVGYEGKRSKNLVKVKKFFDAEYKVLDYDVDEHEVVRDGKSETVEMLSQVWIEHKGHRVKVGSGWTQEQRLQYMDGSIVGKTITVQYFEETHNQEGGISLRFPTVKIVHGDKREM